GTGGKRAVKDRKMFRLEVRSALDAGVLVDVGDDFAGLLGSVAELHEGLRNGVVDNLDDTAADELCVLYECEVGLDACSVAIHHETDGAGGSEHGDLRILETKLFAVG